MALRERGLDRDGIVHEITQHWASGMVATQCQQLWNTVETEARYAIHRRIEVMGTNTATVTCFGCIGTAKPGP